MALQTLPDPAAVAAPPAAPALKLPKSLWLVVVAFGAVSIVMGIVALAYPGLTLAAICVIFGINLIVLSASDLITALFSSAQDALPRVLGVVLALLGLIAGMVVLRQPGRSLVVLVIASGIYFVIAGVATAVTAMTELTADRAARMLGGIATLVLGVVIISLPGLGLATVAVLAGLGLVARGAAAIVVGMALKKA